MKQKVENLLRLTVTQLQEQGELPLQPIYFDVTGTNNQMHGDISSNVAMVFAKATNENANEIAKKIVAALPKVSFIHKIEIAEPGFINFFLTAESLTDVVKTILQQKENYGRFKIGREKKVLVEFVSSNPTGPLKAVHGRHAAFGDVVANLLEAVGFQVAREYYVNDTGKAMDVLTVKVWLCYLAIAGKQVTFPTDQHNHYFKKIAQSIYDQQGERFVINPELILHDVPTENADAAMAILIERVKNALKNQYDVFFDLMLTQILADIREDLAEFGVVFDKWSSEREFASKGSANQLLSRLKTSGHVYQKEKKLWFRSTDFEDEKDRVLINEKDERTFFANDVAYHLNKFDRGFDIAVDIFAADYQGYVPGMRAAVQATEINPERLQVLLMQPVHLKDESKGDEMTLRALREKLGNDAARALYVMRKPNEPLTIDVLKIISSHENPFYYLRENYDKLVNLFKQTSAFDEANGLANLHLLVLPEERQLLNTLSYYPDTIIEAAIHYEPHRLIHFLQDLVRDFHDFYQTKLLTNTEADLRDARLALLAAVKQLLCNGFYLLGIKVNT